MANKTYPIIKELAPEWARFIAQDASGKWYWYECKPVYEDGSWERHKQYQKSKVEYYCCTKSVFPRFSLLHIGE
jgi:hypothetical protein